MSAGELRERIAFAIVAEADSAYGTIAGEWADQFTVAARIQPLRGSEPVIAQRLQGVQPVVIKVRSSSDTRRITTAWRARDDRKGTLFNIRSVTPDERRVYIEMIAEAGVAIGE